MKVYVYFGNEENIYIGGIYFENEDKSIYFSYIDFVIVFLWF